MSARFPFFASTLLLVFAAAASAMGCSAIIGIKDLPPEDDGGGGSGSQTSE